MPTHAKILRPLAIIAVLAIIGAAFFIMIQPDSQKTTIGVNNIDNGSGMRTYDNAVHGIRFTYPDSYVLTERDDGTNERAIHTIVLTDKKAAASVPPNSDGPTSITIGIFDNRVDTTPLRTWIEKTSFSNFKLSPDQTLATTTVASTTAYTYTWDGLYRGESVVLDHGNDIVMLSVTSMDSSDPIRDDFTALLSGLWLK